MADMTDQSEEKQQGAETVDSVLDAIRGRFAAEERRQDETVAASIKARGVLELTDIVADGEIDPASVAPLANSIEQSGADNQTASDVVQPVGLEQSIAQALTEGLQAALLADPDVIPVAIEARLDAMLEPLVTEWLDKNLPDLVERVVRAQVAQQQLDR